MGQPAPSPRGRFDGRVLENRPICVDHYLLRIGLAAFPPTQPGQFINIRCSDDTVAASGRILEWRMGPAGRRGVGASNLPLPRGAAEPSVVPEEALTAPAGRRGLEDSSREGKIIHQPELAGRQPLLRRPISLAGRVDRPDGSVELEIVFHVVGVGTAWLAELPEQAPLDVLGPLGKAFVIAERPIAALVGGGVGIPPLLYLAEALAAAGKQTVAFAGARSRAALPLTIDEAEPPSQAGWPTMCTAEFAARRTPTVVATDDGSLGVSGFVHEPFARWLVEAANSKSEIRNPKQAQKGNFEKPNNTETANPKSEIRNPKQAQKGNFEKPNNAEAANPKSEIRNPKQAQKGNFEKPNNTEAAHPKSEIRNPKSVAVYACGPEPMMRAVAEVCAACGVPCQVALERHMACGMGTCQGCVVKVRSEKPPGWAYKLACKDGPVFPAEELLWE